MKSAAHARKARFGAFELDLRSGELQKHGYKIRLQDQPFQVLAALLERHGEVVTREELRLELWPADTFVDFDVGLNTAIKRLRDALGDSAEEPRYVETLPRRGYRFIAPVDFVESGDAASRGEELAAPATTQQAAPISTGMKGRWSRWQLAGAVGAVCVLLVVAVMLVRGPAPVVPHSVPFTSGLGLAGSPVFLPDGSEIVYTWWEAGTPPRSLLYVQTVGSVTARRLTNDADEQHDEGQPRLWDGGRSVAYVRSTTRTLSEWVDVWEGGPTGSLHAASPTPEEIWSVSRSGGTPRKLLVTGTVRGFDISPDGHEVVFGTVAGPGQPAVIKMSELDSMTSKQLIPTADVVESAIAPNLSAGDYDPRFSPDGRQITFIRRLSVGSDFYVVPAAGGVPRRITEVSGHFYGYTWAADGKSLLIAARFGKIGTATLWRLQLQTGKLEPLPVNAQDVARPAVSLDGRRLAYVQQSRLWNIWRFELPHRGTSPGEGVNLTRSLAHEFAPAYSPDGARIAFDSDRTGHSEIYICAWNGEEVVQLTSFGAEDAGSPAWSPDGKRIAFDYRSGGHAHIFVVDANGGPATQLTTGAMDDVLPRWSRDGKWVYFARQRPGGSDLWKMPSGGGMPIFVVRDAFDSIESADGKTIYYGRMSRNGVYARPLNGGEEQLLIPEAWNLEFFAEPDGLYFVLPAKPPETRQKVCFFEFATRRSRVLLTLPNLTSSASIGVSPDRTNVLVNQRERLQANIMLVENFR